MMKSILSILLALTLTLTCAAAETTSSIVPEVDPAEVELGAFVPAESAEDFVNYWFCTWVVEDGQLIFIDDYRDRLAEAWGEDATTDAIITEDGAELFGTLTCACALQDGLLLCTVEDSDTPIAECALTEWGFLVMRTETATWIFENASEE